MATASGQDQQQQQLQQGASRGYQAGFGAGGGNMRGGQRGGPRRQEEREAWIPVTNLGRLVKSGSIQKLDEIFLHSFAIKEAQIVDYFFSKTNMPGAPAAALDVSGKPTLLDEVMGIKPVQKQSASGQRTRFKAFVIVGDSNGHIGYGTKCAKEVATAIRGAITAAKLAIVPVRRGYWGNNIGAPHTVPMKVSGKCASVLTRLIPAPRGSGVVGSPIAKKVLHFAGVNDCFTSSSGHTRTSGNFVGAYYAALSRTYSVLTPNLWHLNQVTRSPLDVYAKALDKANKLVDEPAIEVGVIGGGSAGLACAKEAARLGAKVCCFDYVNPSPHGSKWGIGGTCVNVGCIPKIIMHNAGKLGHLLQNSSDSLGWAAAPRTSSCDWARLVQTVQSYIKQLNFGYKAGLKSAGVVYINAGAHLLNENTILYNLHGVEKTLQAKFILLAVGGRPYVPHDVPGAIDCAITSDDLFSLKHKPGRTLVVGGSYIALECAGVLTSLGFEVVVAVRSVVLRAFDRQCAEKIRSIMEEMGTVFRMGLQVVRLEKLDDVSPQTSTSEYDPMVPNPQLMQSATGIGPVQIPTCGVQVTFDTGESEVFDTVIYAVGRRSNATHLDCEAAGVELNSKNGKVLVDDHDRTTNPRIFALGDTAEGRPELTPVAVKAGELLARRLFGNGTQIMNYSFVPSVVFTPVEYGFCGVSEEEAIAKYGTDKIEVFLSGFNSVPVSACHWKKHTNMITNEFDTDITPTNLSKLICLKPSNKIIGFHCISFNAGEITQGYALAVSKGLTKDDFDNVVGIHPTDAESFHSLTITRRSGEDFVAAGGCGGGKCG